MATIYHNPACGTSRTVLALLREHGIEPRVVEYLKTPLSAREIKELLATIKLSARALLREKGTPYEALKLDEAHWTEEELIGFMVEHPILIQRPVVVTERGGRICRPPETVLELLAS